MAVSPAVGVSCAGTLAHREEVTPGVFVLEFEVVGKGLPDAPPAPGQFYQFDCGGGVEHMLPRPLSVHGICRWDGDGAVLSFLVEVVGWGTRRLCFLEEGDEVGLLGPLGNGFKAVDDGSSLLVAGGMGVAPLFFLASEMEQTGSQYDLLVGLGTAEQYYTPLEDLAGAVEVYTEDGSMGSEGMVSGGVSGFLAGGKCVAVYACGPQDMMSVVAGLSEDAGVPCQVSLDSRMACGIGACRGCVRGRRGGGNLCVCTDGPVFDSREVAWN